MAVMNCHPNLVSADMIGWLMTQGDKKKSKKKNQLSPAKQKNLKMDHRLEASAIAVTCQPQNFFLLTGTHTKSVRGISVSHLPFLITFLFFRFSSDDSAAKFSRAEPSVGAKHRQQLPHGTARRDERDIGLQYPPIRPSPEQSGGRRFATHEPVRFVTPPKLL